MGEAGGQGGGGRVEGGWWGWRGRAAAEEEGAGVGDDLAGEVARRVCCGFGGEGEVEGEEEAVREEGGEVQLEGWHVLFGFVEVGAEGLV